MLEFTILNLIKKHLLLNFLTIIRSGCYTTNLHLKRSKTFIGVRARLEDEAPENLKIQLQDIRLEGK